MRNTASRALATVAIGTLLIAALYGQRLGPRDVDALPSRPADVRIPYGADPLQYGELRLPKGAGPFPVAVVIHGGCWVSTRATLQNTSALSDALRDVGIATWNIEYRRLDNPGGGWPGTFADVSAGVDALRTIARQHPVDLGRVAVVGHSAGAHLALWAAGRHRLSSMSVLYRADPLPVQWAVAIGGPGDLRDFTTYAADICGAPVIEQLMGGSPAEMPDRYAQASPAELLPLGVSQLLVIGSEDRVMPERSRDAYVAAARQAGDQVELLMAPGAGHFEVIAPTSTVWPAIRGRIVSLLNTSR